MDDGGGWRAFGFGGSVTNELVAFFGGEDHLDGPVVTEQAPHFEKEM